MALMKQTLQETILNIWRIFLALLACFGHRGLDNSNELLEDLDVGWDTNKHDYFNITAFNLHGDDNLSRVSTYGGGDMSCQVVDISFNNVNSASNKDHSGDGSQLIPLQKFLDTGNGGGDKVVEKLEQEKGGGEKVNGGEVVVQERGGDRKSDWWWRRFGGNKMVEEVVVVVGLCLVEKNSQMPY
ncbi:hypothetical protein E3N88_20571 [Mikania micrantha]|uniref:Uncharacterized protein n=1 Tax=Mikania micrantha TaxID=192012 RepID=A0A5N6NK62_9ASTR|nr:hypothetical protein E3N88_20571 [Mikania micrantha]